VCKCLCKHSRAFWTEACVERHLAARSDAQASFVEKPIENVLSKATSGLFQTNEWVFYYSKRASKKKGPMAEGAFSGPYIIVGVLDSDKFIIQQSVRSSAVL